MSDDRTQTTFRAGAFLSEDPVRGALERRRRDRPTDAASAAGPTQLRRWSVTELIARAVPRPPSGGIAH